MRMRLFAATLSMLLIAGAIFGCASCSRLAHNDGMLARGTSSSAGGEYAKQAAAPEGMAGAPAPPPAAEPSWQQELLNDPGWSQPYVAPADSTVKPPSYEQLMEETRKAREDGATIEPHSGESGQNSTTGTTPPPAGSPGAKSRIDRWFSPSAFAADNKPDEEYLIRTGTITLKIDNYDEAIKKVNETAAKYKGVLTDSNMEKSFDGTRSGYVTLRLPKENFFAVWDELAKIGEVTNQNATAQDVGQEYISAMSRMKNLLAEQETLRGMLEEARQVQKTRGLGEAYSVLLQTEQRLSEVSGQLQGVSDQVAQMSDRITRSTITVNLSERAVYQSETFSWRIGETFKAAWKDLLTGVRNLVTGLIYFLVTCWLWLVPLAIVAWIVWTIVKRVRKSAKSRKSGA